VLPLLGTNEGWIRDDLEGGRLERFVQLAEALFLPLMQEVVKLIGRASLLRDLIDIVVEGFRVENRRRDCVVLVVERAEEVVPLQAELPVGPAPTRVCGIIHSLAESCKG
jgi:hypothetical protein